MVSDEETENSSVALYSVLILVLMEDGLGRVAADGSILTPSGLNPCFNGRWSRTPRRRETTKTLTLVLILVLMEDGLGLVFMNVNGLRSTVLILVLMEDGLGLPVPSKTLRNCVLILVLMEDGLGQ